MTNRRDFLRGTAATAFSLAAPADLFAQAAMAAPASSTWDSGAVRHLLPTVSDRRLLIKTSFNTPLSVAPTLRVDGTSVRGRMSDTRGEHWHFHATDLKPGRPHQFSLVGDKGRALCEPWELATFPGPDEQPKQFRVLFFSCAGGHEAMKYLPPAVRMRLFRRALELSATGRRRQWRSYILGSAFTADREALGASPLAEQIAGKFDRAGVVLGGDNETVLKRLAGPQIASIYGGDFRSTPMFFIQDDHDYFDNDEAYDDLITFPPSYFMLPLARATQQLYYPEFLPDVGRPCGLPWSSAADRVDGVSESLRHASLRPARRSPALRHSTHRDAGRTERSLCRSRGRKVADWPGWRRPRSHTWFMRRRIRQAGPPASGASGIRTFSMPTRN